MNNKIYSALLLVWHLLMIGAGFWLGTRWHDIQHALGHTGPGQADPFGLGLTKLQAELAAVPYWGWMAVTLLVHLALKAEKK